jgi:hypothetical protein
MNDTNETQITPTHDQIAALAQILWQLRGSPEGSPEQDWFAAENQLLAQQNTLARAAGQS